MTQNSPVLGLPYIQPAQAQKHVTHNEAISTLEAAVQLSIVNDAETSPPNTPSMGDRYLVPVGADANWGGQDGDIAVWNGSGWRFVSPTNGWSAYVEQTNRSIRFDGVTWGAMSDTVNTLGINSMADLTNRLSVAADATLLNHDGAGHQLKLNKATAAQTASLLFQTGFSGRAEMGTTGNDTFSIKVSDDGTTWTTALTLDGATGLATGEAVQANVDDIGAGKLALTNHTYGPKTVLGPVTQVAGEPTGAVIERVANENGDYVRFADGTQICWSNQFSVDVTLAAGAIFRSSSVDWVFPAAFSVAPAMTQGRQNHSTAYWTVSGVTTLTSGSACAMSYQSIPSRAINLVATGRWF